MVRRYYPYLDDYGKYLLWKGPVDVFSVEKPYKADGVTFHGQAKAVVTNPDTIVVAAASEFLEVGYLPQIPDEAFFEPDGH
jgi:hypothetical protein